MPLGPNADGKIVGGMLPRKEAGPSPTPGPWRMRQSDSRPSAWFVEAQGESGEWWIVAEVCGQNRNEANARLIVAAWGMFDALRKVIDHVHDMTVDRNGSQCTLCYTYRHIIMDALAKVEGDSAYR